MMNVSVSITEKGISPNIANHRELKAKILVYRRQVLRWFLIYLVLSNHTQMHMIYVIWKSKGATIIIWQREIEEWKKIWHLRMAENDVSMKIFDAAAIVYIWSEPSKLQTFNNT